MQQKKVFKKMSKIEETFAFGPFHFLLSSLFQTLVACLMGDPVSWIMNDIIWSWHGPFDHDDDLDGSIRSKLQQKNLKDKKFFAFIHKGMCSKEAYTFFINLSLLC